MDKVFELSTRERFDALLQRKGELSKSNTYYHSIHPVEAAEVDAKLAEAAAAAAAKKKAAAEKATATSTPASGSASGSGSGPAAPGPPQDVQ
jgi:NADH-quinone oxidoreductase subunit I